MHKRRSKGLRPRGDGSRGPRSSGTPAQPYRSGLARFVPSLTLAALPFVAAIVVPPFLAFAFLMALFSGLMQLCCRVMRAFYSGCMAFSSGCMASLQMNRRWLLFCTLILNGLSVVGSAPLRTRLEADTALRSSAEPGAELGVWQPSTIPKGAVLLYAAVSFVIMLAAYLVMQV